MTLKRNEKFNGPLTTSVQGQTTIAIAHRLSTLRKAKKLIVLNQGKVAEIGTHADLLQAGGEYARLYRAQMQSALGRDSAEFSVNRGDDTPDSVSSTAQKPFYDKSLDAMEIVAQGRGELLISSCGESRVVYPVRCFPLTELQEWVSLIDVKGSEVAIIETLSGLSGKLRDLIEGALKAREFLPVITAITHISVESAHSEWHISTNRGPTKFTLGHDDHVRSLGKHRFVVTDSHGMRYFVNDVNRLDGKSRRLLSRYF